MSPKRILLISVAMGAVAVLLLLRASGAQGTVTVFQATRSVGAGEVLGDTCKPVGMPAQSFEAVKSQVPTAEFENWVRRTTLARSIREGETVTFDHFLKSADQGLQIAAGKRAVAIEVNGPQAVGYLVHPGDYVDVLGTLREGERLVSKTLLQAKRVLATGQQYRIEDSAFLNSHEFSTVTLEVSPEEAQKITHVRPLLTDGFTLALRPPGDRNLVAVPSVDMNTPQFDAIGNR